MLMRTMHATTVALIASLALATAASANPLAPGGVIFPTGTTAAANPNLAGVVQNDNLITFRMDPTPATPFTDVGGTVQNRVVANASGDLIFAPRIRDTFNIDGGTFAITSIQLDGFGTFSTDVDFRTDGLGDKGFTSVSRSLSGDIMTFRYDDPLLVDALNPPGRQEESLFPSILTDATDYALTGRMTIFGQLVDAPVAGRVAPVGELTSVTISGIAVPVPEPAALTLVAVGIVGLSLGRRRRKKDSQD